MRLTGLQSPSAKPGLLQGKGKDGDRKVESGAGWRWGQRATLYLAWCFYTAHCSMRVTSEAKRGPRSWIGVGFDLRRPEGTMWIIY